MTSARVKGHALDYLNTRYDASRFPVRWASRVFCECGWNALCDCQADARAKHREHKAEVVSARRDEADR